MTSKLTITDERLAELVAFRPLPGTDINSATRDEWMAMAAELHERRKADSEPVVYASEETLAYAAHGELLLRVLSQPAGDAIIPLYRHAQQSVMPDNSAITQHFDTIALETAREIMCDVNRRHEFLGGEIQLLSRIQCRIDNACRAAMLQAGNSPVIPEGYVMVPKEPTAEMVIKMRYHVGGYDRNIKEGYKAMLAAAPQGVKGE